MAADRYRKSHGSASFRNNDHRSSRHGFEDEYKDSKRNCGPSRLHRPEIKTEHDEHKQGEEMSDGEFDFSKHKYTLNKIFFREQDVIQRGSVEYDDFWTFLKRYKDFEKKKSSTTGPKNDKSKEVRNRAENDLGIPVNYDKRYKINFSIMSGDIEELVRRIPIDTDDKDHLPRNRIAEFRYILLLYLDFRQKERFLKMQKLRHAQSNLPIAQYKTTIIKALQNNQVIVVAGDTGCGKSTQVPQYLLEAGFGQIACTQPRRIACISLSKRVAFETLNEYGSQVGYQIRFDRSKTQHTKILFLTEGLLLRQVTTDPSLSGYNVIVLDEVHERHLHGDFLLGVIKCLLHQRKDLKVVMMSATINIDLFKNYFWNAPVIQVPGRLYPININYRPVSVVEKSSKTSRVNPAPYVRILQMIDDKYPQNERGDVLIFLSGMTEISTVVEAANTYNLQTQRWIILPLHSTLSIAEQDKVFDIAPDGVRKCIISTNIAETSITIDGIRFVIDSGKVKEMDFDPSCKMQRLREFWISRASAEQRKGRAGRTGPGVCFRLYSEAEFSAMSEYSTPEIQRVSLDTLVLQMIAMGLPDARKFPFIEPPPAESIENAVQSLKDHDALNYDEKLTPVGQMLSNLPVDIAIGKILIMGTLFHKVDPILSLASAMSVQSPFTNKSYRDTEAVAARKPLESDHGDPFTLLNVYNEWLTMKASQQAQSKKWCKRRGLEEQRFYEMTKLRRQFKDLLKDSGLLESMNRQGMGGLSSSERSQRHGDVKRLRELKRNFHRAPKRRKVLKLNVDGGESGSDEGEDVDIKDIEFQLQNNRTQVEELSLASRDFTLKDLQILKIILCSGIYPQVAIADEHNSYKPGTDQLFHTKNKPFVILHPNGVFSSIPEVLELHDSDRVDVPGFKSKQILSSRHQLLSYVSLMETTKPYLVNTMRVTSVHTVLLFAQEIDTNYDFSKIVFDRWLHVRIPEAACGQDLIMQTAEIRDMWHKMLSLVVKKENQASAAPIAQSQDVVEMRHTLTNMLIGFLQEEVVHSISRLLAADQKTLYLGPEINEEMEVVSIMNDFKAFPHPKKGGIQLTDYLTYNCLQEDNFFSEAKVKNAWICPYCDCSIVVSVLERMQHHWKCKRKHERHHIDKTSMEDRIDDKNPLKNDYFCPNCDKNFRFTKTEILRHIRSHKPRD